MSPVPGSASSPKPAWVFLSSASRIICRALLIPRLLTSRRPSSARTFSSAPLSWDPPFARPFLLPLQVFRKLSHQQLAVHFLERHAPVMLPSKNPLIQFISCFLTRVPEGRWSQPFANMDRSRLCNSRAIRTALSILYLSRALAHNCSPSLMKSEEWGNETNSSTKCVCLWNWIFRN